jgi:hypothetical protein
MQKTVKLSPRDIHETMKRFPSFNVSYETMLHKNQTPATDKYNVILSIPYGKKYYMWFTYFLHYDVCILIELNKGREIVNVEQANIESTPQWAFGTVLYGCVLPQSQTFVIENIYWYQGLSMQCLTYGNRLGYIYDFLCLMKQKNNEWNIRLCNHNTIVSNANTNVNTNYKIHHYQYRSLHTTCPFLKQLVTNNNNESVSFRPQFKKSIYKRKCVFAITPLPNYDIYEVYAYDDCAHKRECIGIAGIPTLQLSRYMNSLFRNIRENNNIDLVEESDNEDEFEDENADKYTHMSRVLFMDCQFDEKTRKWIPLGLSNTRRIVSLSAL